MTLVSSANTPPRLESREAAMSLYHLLDPEVLANPYPLFRRMRSEDPVHWDPFLHAWIVNAGAGDFKAILLPEDKLVVWTVRGAQRYVFTLDGAQVDELHTPWSNTSVCLLRPVQVTSRHQSCCGHCLHHLLHGA